MPEIQPDIWTLSQLVTGIGKLRQKTYDRCYEQNLGSERASLADVRRPSLHFAQAPSDDNNSRE
jgi:hypothetical protein